MKAVWGTVWPIFTGTVWAFAASSPAGTIPRNVPPFTPMGRVIFPGGVQWYRRNTTGILSCGKQKYRIPSCNYRKAEDKLNYKDAQLESASTFRNLISANRIRKRSWVSMLPQLAEPRGATRGQLGLFIWTVGQRGRFPVLLPLALFWASPAMTFLYICHQ